MEVVVTVQSSSVPVSWWSAAASRVVPDDRSFPFLEYHGYWHAHKIAQQSSRVCVLLREEGAPVRFRRNSSGLAGAWAMVGTIMRYLTVQY